MAAPGSARSRSRRFTARRMAKAPSVSGEGLEGACKAGKRLADVHFGHGTHAQPEPAILVDGPEGLEGHDSDPGRLEEIAPHLLVRLEPGPPGCALAEGVDPGREVDGSHGWNAVDGQAVVPEGLDSLVQEVEAALDASL